MNVDWCPSHHILLPDNQLADMQVYIQIKIKVTWHESLQRMSKQDVFERVMSIAWNQQPDSHLQDGHNICQPGKIRYNIPCSSICTHTDVHDRGVSMTGGVLNIQDADESSSEVIARAQPHCWGVGKCAGNSALALPMEQQKGDSLLEISSKADAFTAQYFKGMLV